MLRLGFFILMVLGVFLFFGPITTLFGYMPLVGGFLKGVAGLVVILGGILFSLPIYTMVLGIAWIRYRPYVGISCLVFAFLLTVFFALKK